LLLDQKKKKNRNRALEKKAAKHRHDDDDDDEVIYTFIARCDGRPKSPKANNKSTGLISYN